uniref:F-box domain-containing protein n=1 Tax=Globodera pallida TaxID=36090 RepID=A0A183BLP0_GLOPA
MPKFVPIELVIEIVDFVKFDQKWARIRVSQNFDFDLLKRMAKWLMNLKKIIEECQAAMAEFNNSINEMPPQKRAGAYKRLYQHIADILSLPSLESIGAAHENVIIQEIK